MRYLPFQKVTASFMLLLVFTLMPVSFCRGECHKEAGKNTCHQEEGVSKAVTAMHHGQETAPDADSKPVQRVPGFHCPCVLPMPPEHDAIAYSPVVFRLNSFDPFKAPPEVFLPIFVPPQSLV